MTQALLDDGHRAVGLCNVAIGFQRRFARLLDVDPSSVVLEHVGLNHLTWERAAYVDGVDRLPQLLSEHLDLLALAGEFTVSVSERHTRNTNSSISARTQRTAGRSVLTRPPCWRPRLSVLKVGV